MVQVRLLIGFYQKPINNKIIFTTMFNIAEKIVQKNIRINPLHNQFPLQGAEGVVFKSFHSATMDSSLHLFFLQMLLPLLQNEQILVADFLPYFLIRGGIAHR